MKAFVRRGFAVGALAALGAFGCGGRDAVWDTPATGKPEALGLEASVAVVDRGGKRLLMLPVDADQTLAPVSIGLPEGFAGAAVTRDRKRLLALSRGVVPRRRADQAGPSATVVSPV